MIQGVKNIYEINSWQCQCSLEWREIKHVYNNTDPTGGKKRQRERERKKAMHNEILLVIILIWSKKKNEINSRSEVIKIMVCMQWMQAVRNRARERERETERRRAREATRAGALMTDTPWAPRRPIGALGSPELLQRRSERGFSHTRAHMHPDRSRAAQARQGSADTRWQWYTWDRKSVWKLYSTHRRHRDICGLISLGKVEYFPFLCIIPNVFCVVWERVSYLKEVVVHQPTRESE